jgi:hypothetical protein
VRVKLTQLASAEGQAAGLGQVAERFAGHSALLGATSVWRAPAAT